MGKLNLHIGDYGQEVMQVKQMLNALEYRVSDQTDVFDEQTHRALKAFQNDFGIGPTGVVDDNTWEVLKRESQRRQPNESKMEAAVPQNNEYGNTVTTEEMADVPLERHSPESVSIESLMPKPEFEQAMEAGIDLKEGDSGASVTELQEILRDLGYLNAEPNGIFNRQTTAAVRAVQTAHGLPINGVVNSKTWEALNMEHSVVPDAFEISAPAPMPADMVYAPAPKPMMNATHAMVRKGSTGADVVLLQEKLRMLGFYKGEIDGIFGARTDAALRTFQGMQGLVMDGIAGPKTWEALEQAAPPPMYNFY